MKISYLLITALAFASCSPQTKDSNIVSEDIVIVNCGARNRLDISKMLDVISSLNPRVVALDINFRELRDPYQDSLLIVELGKCKNLVMSSIIDNYSGENDTTYSQLTGTLPEFLTNAKIGFTNAILENDELGTLKRFSCYENVNGLTMYHFAIRTAMTFDSLKVSRFLADKKRIIDVNYKGDETVFKTFSDDDILEKKVKRTDIEERIVLIGYLGPSDEDKFFSPLNKEKQHFKPDMYGVVYLANVIVQILK